jgi:hypothetical protein
MCVPNGHEKFGRVVGDLGLEVGFEAVGQVVGGERLERDGGERHRAIGRALHGERAAGELEVVGDFELVGGDLLGLVDHLVAGHGDGDPADGQRPRPVGVEAERRDGGVGVEHVDVVGADAELLGGDHRPRGLVPWPCG